jgi:lipopolysaccharide assembly outer membrane protein LptD (OstA)
MKRLALSAMVFVLVSLPSSGISQQASRGHVSAKLVVRGVGLYKIDFTADSMQRQDRVISFTGNVEVRITSISGQMSPVINSDQVIYNLDTGDVEIPFPGNLTSHLTFGIKQ